MSSESSTALTPKETQMLATIFSLMGDAPQIDYDKLAERLGIKYARNARTSCKKLLQKIKGHSGTGAAVGGDSDNGEGDTGGPSKKPTKAVKKAVGKNAAPKKAANSRPPKAKYNGKKKAKTALKKEEPEDENLLALDNGDDENNYGKSLTPNQPPTTSIKEPMVEIPATQSSVEGIDGKADSTTSPHSPAHGIDGKAESIVSFYDEAISNYTSDDERKEAEERGISLEEWRAWKLKHNIDNA
ncbi:hypothetical protein B0O99DRAFT_688565 [Bisporella sp. PMI_857]|nr:hypothetical protein B0O99DRAFT_688565 [Bisporella sp. PMI_857]